MLALLFINEARALSSFPSFSKRKTSNSSSVALFSESFYKLLIEFIFSHREGFFKDKKTRLQGTGE
jgi:hypothetical protein